jgi:hypothetical protein
MRTSIKFTLLISLFASGCCEVRDPVTDCCLQRGPVPIYLFSSRTPEIQRSELSDGGVVNNEATCTRLCGYRATTCQYIADHCRNRPNPYACDAGLSFELLLCYPGNWCS